MSNTAESTPPAEPAPEKPAIHWLGKALVTGAALTAAANYLLYSRGPGAGWAAFFLLLSAGIFINRRNTGLIRGIEIGLGALLAASALQMVNRPSWSNAIVLFTLTLIASTHFLQEGASDTPAARKLAEGLRNLFLAPLRWLQATHLTAAVGIALIPNMATTSPAPHKLMQLLKIVVPAGLLVLPFAVLLSKGNSILGQFVSNTFTDLLDALSEASPPSPARIFFIATIATALLGLLWRTRPSTVLDRLLTRLGRTIPAPGDHFVARWRTILILAGVNALFFISNSIDLTYIGSDLELPRHLSYSEFVHQGTNSLIASAIIAAILLGLLFQQHESVTRARGIRALAFLWIAQNLLLLVNVARRVEIYVSAHHLSVLRLHLALFLALVGTGFLLLGIRILRNKSFGWLVTANLATTFILFASVQFWDTRKTVAEYNLARAIEDSGKVLDTAYLAELGPSAWPTLEAATTAALSQEEKVAARRALERIAAAEAAEAIGEDWRDFRWTRSRLRKQFATGD